MVGGAPVEKQTRNNSIKEERKNERKSDLNVPFIGSTMAARPHNKLQVRPTMWPVSHVAEKKSGGGSG